MFVCVRACTHTHASTHAACLHQQLMRVTNQLLMKMTFIRIYSQITMRSPVSHSPRCSCWYDCFEMLFVAAFGSVLKSR